MIDNNDIAFVKDYLPFISEMSDTHQTEFISSIKLKHYPANTIIADESICSGMIIIKNGQVRAHIDSNTGKQITLYRLIEGDVCVLSASCVMKNLTFSVTIESEKDSDVFVLPVGTFERLMSLSPQLKDYTLAIMSQRLSDTLFIVEQTLFSSFDKRLAHFILEQSNLEGSETIKITQDTIANHLGTAREVVTRMLNYFASEGYVRLFRGGFSIIDSRGLNALGH